MVYNVTPTKVEGGWDLAVEGHGTVRSPTLKGAERALLEYLAELSGQAPDAVEYVCDPPVLAASQAALLGYVARHTEGALLTIRRDARPQISNVAYRVTPEGTIIMAATEGRAKVHNLRRDPRGSLYVSHDFFSYVQVSGETSVSAAAAREDDEIADQFVEHFTFLQGAAADANDLRRQAVLDRRVMISLQPSRATGLLSGGS